MKRSRRTDNLALGAAVALVWAGVLVELLDAPVYFSLHPFGFTLRHDWYIPGPIPSFHRLDDSALVGGALVITVLCVFVWRRMSVVNVPKPTASIVPRRSPVPAPVYPQGLTPRDALRIKMWRSRNRAARPAGFVMLLVSALFFFAAYVSNSVFFEVMSLTAFILGTGLVLSELEPRVNLLPVTQAQLSPLLGVAELARKRLGRFASEYQPSDGGGMMTLRSVSGNDSIAMTPLGGGLYETFEKELGPLKGTGYEHASQWIPKTMTQGLGMADKVSIERRDGKITARITKPYVRGLCTNTAMAKGVCNSMGCPLAASIGQTFAQALESGTRHESCTYDSSSQVATLTLSTEEED